MSNGTTPGSWHHDQPCLGIGLAYCMKHERNNKACFEYQIVTAARKNAHNSSNPQNGGLCLQLTVSLIEELSRYGIRGILQAGSAQWKCVAVDDGISPTHFAYMWELSPLTKQRIADGKLPEIHCWVGLPDTQEIIDISTNNLVEQAKLRADIDWTAELPPDYIWCGRDDFPMDARYMVDPLAIAVALHFAQVSLNFTI